MGFLADLQTILNRDYNSGLTVDDKYGPKTDAALKAALAGPVVTAPVPPAGGLQQVPATNDIAVKQNQKLAAEALAFALKWVGQREATGHNDGAFVNKVQEFVGGKGEDGAPWCACFYSYCNYNADPGIVPVTPKSDSSTSLYAWAKAHGYLLPHPIPGCLGLLRGTGGTAGKTHHHTFRVMTVDTAAGVVHTVDGNESNMVRTTTHPISACDFAVCI